MFGLSIKTPIKQLAEEIKNQEIYIYESDVNLRKTLNTFFKVKDVCIRVESMKCLSSNFFIDFFFKSCIETDYGEFLLNKEESNYIGKVLFKKFEKQKELENKKYISELKEKDSVARSKIISLFNG